MKDSGTDEEKQEYDGGRHNDAYAPGAIGFLPFTSMLPQGVRECQSFCAPSLAVVCSHGNGTRTDDLQTAG